MVLLLSTHHFSSLGGTETYLVTVAEQLERLGHEVTIHAVELGEMADVARSRGLRVAAAIDELPEAPDAVLAQDGVTALALADRHPAVPQVFVVHGADLDLMLPPALPELTAAVVVMNDRVARRVRSLSLEHDVVRLRQPIDLDRFRPRGVIRDEPRRVLLLGNYLRGHRRDRVAEVCEAAGLRCEQLGAHGAHASAETAAAISEADIVIGYGRAVLEGMASGRAAYVLDHLGGDGWVTPESYPAMEADGFYAGAQEEVIDPARLASDLAGYRADMGIANHDLARTHHDANRHAQELVELLGRVGARPRRVAGPLEEMARLVRLQWQADSRAGALALESQIVREEREDLRRRLAGAEARAREAERRLGEAVARDRAIDELVRARPYRLALDAEKVANRLRRAMGSAPRSLPPGGLHYPAADGPAAHRIRVVEAPARPETGTAVVLSPHLDDAVLSCWHLLTAPSGAVVVNLFAGVPEGLRAVPVGDRMAGARDAAARMRERIAEDRSALAAIEREPVNLGFLEAHYRAYEQSPEPLVEAVRAHVSPDDRLYAPAGIGGHADHLLARDVALRLLTEGYRVSLYAELPYASYYGWPPSVAGGEGDPHLDVDAYWAEYLAGAGIDLAGAPARVHRLEGDEHAAKLAGVTRYRTQFPVLEGGSMRRLTGTDALAYEVVWTLALG